MHRRRLLVALGTGLGGLAGCSGSDDGPGDGEGDGRTPADGTPSPTPSPTPQSLHVPDFAFEEGENGSSVVVLTVENRGNLARDRTMVVTIEDRDGENRRQGVDVSLEPGERATYRVRFEVDWEWYGESPNLQDVAFE